MPSNGASWGKRRALCSSKHSSIYLWSFQNGGETINFDAVHFHANVSKVEVIKLTTRFS